MTQPLARADELVPARGLTSAEVAERIANGQTNKVVASAGRTTGQIVFANVFTLFNLIVGALFVLMVIVGPLQDAVFGLVAIANTLIGTIQELRAKRSLERLALIGRPTVRAWRDGAIVELQPEDVVLDDVLELSSGTQAVVDGTVIEFDALEVDESLLTGEADPVVKRDGDQVMSGSFAVAGSGSMRVTAVGADAYAAKLVAEASRFELVHSQIMSDINQVLKLITWVIIPISVLLAISQLRDNESFADAVSGTVAGIVTMIPEGLVLLTSIAFAVGVIRLGRKGCLVQELAAVEGLARVDVVCADKTGTLTEDRMEVVELLMLDGASEQDAPDGARRPGLLRRPTERLDAGHRRRQSGRPGVDGDRSGGVLVGAQVERRVVRRSRQLGRSAHPRCCSRRATDAVAKAGERAEQGLRVLLLGRSSEPVDAADAPASVEPVALVVVAQAVRPDSASTLAYFRDQGVGVKVISGDDPRTVGAIAKSAGTGHGRSACRRPQPGRRLGDRRCRRRTARCSAESRRTRSGRWSAPCSRRVTRWR